MGKRRRLTRNKNRLLDADDLERMWVGGECVHGDIVATVAGPGVAFACPDCRKGMGFKLRLGRPKTFQVSVSDRPGKLVGVGRATVEAGADFLRNNNSQLVMSDDEQDDESSASWFVLSGLVLDVLEPDEPKDAPPPTDFAAAWAGMACQHESTYCEWYGDTLEVWCNDCIRGICFELYGEEFRVAAFGSDDDYGMHGVDEVVEYVREYGGVLLIPSALADSMSDDPERDAAKTARLAELLEQHGLFGSADHQHPQITEVANAMSVMRVTRDQFEERARSMIKQKHWGVTFFRCNGKLFSPRQAVEVMRLLWPYWHIETGIALEYYNPNGREEFCPKCWLNTQDDDEEYDWACGCPKCGYMGYLVDI